MARSKFKLSMLTPSEMKAHKKRVATVTKLAKQGKKVMKRAMKRNKK